MKFSKSDFEMQSFESRRPSQPVRLQLKTGPSILLAALASDAVTRLAPRGGVDASAARRIGVTQEPGGGAAESTMAGFAKTGAGACVNRTCRLDSEQFRSALRTLSLEHPQLKSTQ